MKKILLTTIVLIFIAYLKVSAQQEPQFTHYMFNKLIYNPAATGGNGEYVTVTGLGHYQWTGFTDPEGGTAPVTYTASVDGSIHPQALQKQNQFIGLGFSLLNDKEVFVTSTGFMFYGSYHLVPKFGGDLSIGFNAGMLSKAIDPKWNAANPGDPLLPGAVSSYGADAGLGVYYSTVKWYAGVSALHLPATKIDWSTANGSATYTFDRTYFITGGYNYDIKQNPDLELQPSVLVKTDGATTSFSLTGLFLYKQRFWGGLDLRSENVTALSVMLGMYILPDLKLGYSYDVATQTPTPFGGTHELMFSYRFKIHVHVEPPVFDRTPRWL